MPFAILLESGDQLLLESGDVLLLQYDSGLPIRRRYRQDTDARDDLTERPSAPRGRADSWWG